MPKGLLLILITLLSGGCSQTLTVESEKDRHGIPVGYGISLLGKLEGTEVFDGSEKYSIKLPCSFADLDVAYGSSYFRGSKFFKTGNSVFFLIANYATGNPSAVFDLNGNADFTDDSIFNIKFREPFTVTLVNSVDTNAKLPIIYRLLDSAEVHLGLVFKSDSFRMKRKPLSYYLIEKDLGYKRAALPDGNVISLFDRGPNGIFNEKWDEVMAGDITKDTFKLLRRNPQYVKGAKTRDLLIFPNQTYKLISVDKYGDHVTLQPLNIKVKPVDKLPNFSYIDAKGDKQSFKADKSKGYTVIYFWGSWCIGCHERSPLFMKFMTAHPDLAYYTFNSRDSKERMLKYLQVKALPFEPNQITTKTEKKLFLTSFPMFFLVDRNGVILVRTGDLELVENYLAKKSIK